MPAFILDPRKSMKKLGAAVVTCLVNIIGEAMGLDQATINNITLVLVSYIVGQGIADHGKERAKIEHANGKH